MFSITARFVISVMCAAMAMVTPGPALAVAPDGWDPPVVLARANDPLESADPVITPDGTMVLVWVAGGDVVFSERSPGGAWSDPVTLVDTGRVTAAQLAVDGAGIRYLVWTERTGAGPRIRYRHTLTGGGWSEIQTIASRSTGTFDSINFTVTATGEAAVGWMWGDRLLMIERLDGVGWVGLTQWNNILDFDLALSRTGLAAVVMTSLRNSAETVQVLRRPRNADWSAPHLLTRLTAVAPPLILMGRVALDDSGTATVAWRGATQDPEIGSWRTLVSRARQDGSWGRPRALATKVGFSFSPVEVMSTPQGAASVVWDRSNGAVQASRRAVGADWTRAVTISPALRGKSTINLNAALEPSGQAVAVWSRRREGDDPRGVFVSLMNRGGSWRKPVALATATAAVSRPRAAIGDAGALVSWSRLLSGSRAQLLVRTRTTG